MDCYSLIKCYRHIFLAMRTAHSKRHASGFFINFQIPEQHPPAKRAIRGSILFFAYVFIHICIGFRNSSWIPETDSGFREFNQFRDSISGFRESVGFPKSQILIPYRFYRFPKPIDTSIRFGNPKY